jgi:hypothetical protein
MAHDVFISYASSDRNAALAVLHGLERAGIRCWMAPRDIKPGAIWAQAIMEAIQEARALVVVFSASANRSANVINEVDAAVRKGAIIVPLRIEDVMPEGAMEYHLRTRHWLDALTPDLEAHTVRLAEQVGALLATGGAPVLEPPSGHRQKPADLPARPSRPPRAPGPPGRWKRRGTLALIGLVGLAAAGYAITRKRVVKDVEFTVREVSSSGGNEFSLRIRSEGLRFFESGSGAPPLAQRQYATRFAAGVSRFINVEVRFQNEAPGREMVIPMSCDIFTSTDQVFTSLAIHAKMQADWTSSAYYNGWGTARGGWWKPGRYRVECKYGGKLIGRDWFEMVSGGAGEESPPPAPPPPPPNRPILPVPPPAPSGRTAGPLGRLGARVRSMRFFESGYGTTPMDQREYRNEFSAADTRFVNVELVLEHQAPGRQMAASLGCEYQRDGTPIGTPRFQFRLEGDATGSVATSGWGARNPGTWAPGSYLVICEENGVRFSQARFEIR